MAVPSAEFLSRVDLFAALRPADQAQLAAVGRRRRYCKGAVLVLASDAGKEFTSDLLGPGECFGELALLDGESRSADAITQDDSAVLEQLCAFAALARTRGQSARAARLVGAADAGLKRLGGVQVEPIGRRDASGIASGGALLERLLA